MNKERLKILADTLREMPTIPLPGDGVVGFNMNIDFGEALEEYLLEGDICDSVGCVGGWTVVIFGNKEDHKKLTNGMLWGGGVLSRAQELLELDEATADKLFYPEWCPAIAWSDITRQQIVPIIEHLIETGKVPTKEEMEKDNGEPTGT